MLSWHNRSSPDISLRNATLCYACPVRRISQRELRNESATVMDAVEAGEAVIITRRGIEVAELRPLPAEAAVSRADLYRALGNLPPGDLAAERYEADAFFGDEDRLDDGDR